VSTGCDGGIGECIVELKRRSVVLANLKVVTAILMGSCASSSSHGGSCGLEAIVCGPNVEIGLSEGGRLSHNMDNGSGHASTDRGEHDYIVNLLIM